MLDLTYLYAHKGRPVRTLGFDELPGEDKTQLDLIEPGLSGGPSATPLVVWRCTQSCNLACRQCYSQATCGENPGELSTREAKMMMGDLREAGVTAINFSGGEPLLRRDFMSLARHAKEIGMERILSTNGTLLVENKQILAAIGFDHVNVSLPGVGAAHDGFRGHDGAFNWTVHGIKSAQEVGLKVVLRVNLTRDIILQLPLIFNFILEQDIQNVVFTHLFPFGRGWQEFQPSAESIRLAIDSILKATRELNAGNRYVRIFVSGNICDGAYLYQGLLERNDPKSERSHDFMAGGAEQFGSAGNEPPCIDWVGDVHPNQFDLQNVLGNVRQDKFANIMRRGCENEPKAASWPDNIRDRCLRCRYVDLCLNGSKPTVLSDEAIRKAHPTCYLTDEETIL